MGVIRVCVLGVTPKCHTISYYTALGISPTFFYQYHQDSLPKGLSPPHTCLSLQLGGLLSLPMWATEQLSKSQRLAAGTALAPQLKAISTSETVMPAHNWALLESA